MYDFTDRQKPMCDIAGDTGMCSYPSFSLAQLKSGLHKTVTIVFGLSAMKNDFVFNFFSVHSACDICNVTYRWLLFLRVPVFLEANELICR